MGDEQKEIVRLESFWINTWLKKHYKGLETRFIIHDAAAKEVDENTFFEPVNPVERSSVQPTNSAKKSSIAITPSTSGTYIPFILAMGIIGVEKIHVYAFAY